MTNKKYKFLVLIIMILVGAAIFLLINNYSRQQKNSEVINKIIANYNNVIEVSSEENAEKNQYATLSKTNAQINNLWDKYALLDDTRFNSELAAIFEMLKAYQYYIDDLKDAHNDINESEMLELIGEIHTDFSSSRDFFIEYNSTNVLYSDKEVIGVLSKVIRGPKKTAYVQNIMRYYVYRKTGDE